MSNLTTTYTLEGDNQSPRAYLEGVIGLLEERQSGIAIMLRDATTQRQASYERGRVDALDNAIDIVRDVLSGLPKPVEGDVGGD